MQVVQDGHDPDYDFDDDAYFYQLQQEEEDEEEDEEEFHWDYGDEVDRAYGLQKDMF